MAVTRAVDMWQISRFGVICSLNNYVDLKHELIRCWDYSNGNWNVYRLLTMPEDSLNPTP